MGSLLNLIFVRNVSQRTVGQPIFLNKSNEKGEGGDVFKELKIV